MQLHSLHGKLKSKFNILKGTIINILTKESTKTHTCVKPNFTNFIIMISIGPYNNVDITSSKILVLSLYDSKVPINIKLSKIYSIKDIKPYENLLETFLCPC